MRTHAKLLAVLVTVAVVVAGCGGSSSGVSAAAYAKSACTAVLDLQHSVVSRVSKLQAGLRAKSVPQAKSAYVTLIGALQSATGQAERQLKAAGTPNVTNGKRIAHTLVQDFGGAAASLATLEKRASTLPTSSIAAFQSAARPLGAQIQAALNGIGKTTPSQSPELSRAAKKDPTCQKLTTGG